MKQSKAAAQLVVPNREDGEGPRSRKLRHTNFRVISRANTRSLTSVPDDGALLSARSLLAAFASYP